MGGNVDLFVFLFVSLVVFWWISVFLDRLFDEKPCSHCGQWTNARHMIEYRTYDGTQVQYWHTHCFLMNPPSESPLPDSE